MNWQRVGTHGMQSGDYRVAKNYVDGCTLYVCFYKDKRICTKNDFDECKEVAEKHEREKAVK